MNTHVSVVTINFKVTEETSREICQIVERLFAHELSPIRLRVTIEGDYSQHPKIVYRTRLYVELQTGDFFASDENAQLLPTIHHAVERAERILAELGSSAGDAARQRGAGV